MRNPDSAAGQVEPSPRAAPASDWLCDGVVVAFALWTVCCHAVVAAGRGLLALLALSTVAFAAAAVLWWWARGRAARSRPLPNEAAEISAPGQPLPWTVGLAAIMAGAAVALGSALQRDIYFLWWSAVIGLGIAAVVVCAGDAPRIWPAERSRSSEMLLWLLAAAAVALTLIAHRPDADDSFYVNVAVAASEAPGRALLSLDTMHGVSGMPLHLSVYRVDSYELLNGALAYLTSIPPIYCFHWVSAAAAALFVPLAYAKLFRVLSPQRWLAAVTTLMVVLVAVGETHRWYGNFAFVRMWQGKAVFLSIFLPLVYAYALRFAASPNLRDWIMLGAAQIAAAGCTSSALWAAPASAAVAMCAGVPLSRQGLRVLILGIFASPYVVGAALVVRGSLEVAARRWVFVEGPREVPALDYLSNALVVTLGDSRLLIFAIGSLLTAWVFAPRGLGRRFAVVVPLAVLLGFLNPYTATWLSRNVTGPAFWRSMWALPLPIMMALMLTAPLHVWDGTSRPAVRRVIWVALVVGFALLIPQYGGLSPQNGVRLAWPSLKVPEPAYQWAAAVNESAGPGSYVAVSSDIDPWIVTFPHHAHPLLVRTYLRTWPNHMGRQDLKDRMDMRRFLDSPELVEATPQRFREILDRFEVRAVCMVSSAKGGAARTVLGEAGFRPTRRREDYELWLRPDPGAASRKPPPA